MGTLVLAACILAGSLAWLFWPEAGAGGASVTARSKQAPAVDPDALSTTLISSEDLPPEGTRSLFDHLIAQNESLPYPFEKLVALIQSHDPQGRPPVSLMIPLGRSLLKAQADFLHPRVLVAADFEGNNAASLGLAARGQLFLGFVESAAEIEVISYNEAAGRFEFQLVQDYRESGTPRIVYARRAVCTTCHQGAAPIFPQRPWNETNGQPEIKARIVEARGAEPYLGVPALSPLDVPERFDQLTDVGNFIPPTQKAWLDGCGTGTGGAACRRQLLKLALRYAWNPGALDAAGADAARLRELQSANWPREGIAVAESDLRNRDPLGEERSLRARLHDFFTRRTVPGADPKSNEDLDAFDRLPRLPAELDPVSPRPPRRVLTAQDIDGVYGLASMFTVADIKALEAGAGADWARVEAAVEALPDEAFAPAPFSRVRSLQRLLGERSYCCLDTAEMSPPVALGEPPLALPAGSVLQPFEEYCFACHRGNPSRRLNFMSGKSEAEVLANIRESGKIRDVLDWPRYLGTDQESTLMPPPDSVQHARLVAALKQDPQLLEKMREAVPGLFDF